MRSSSRFDSFVTSLRSRPRSQPPSRCSVRCTRVVNTAPLPSSVPKLLLQILLVKTGDASLPFLASIWANATASYSAAVRLAALRHADAYLSAQAQASAQARPKTSRSSCRFCSRLLPIPKQPFDLLPSLVLSTFCASLSASLRTRKNKKR